MRKLHYLFCLTALLSLAIAPGFAQQSDAPAKPNKKVIVVEKVKDENGQVFIEKTITEGEAAEKMIIELEQSGELKGTDDKSVRVIKEIHTDGHATEDHQVIIKKMEHHKGQYNVEVNEEDGKKTILIQRPDGTEEKFELEKGETLPQETKDRLTEEGIFIGSSEGKPLNWTVRGEGHAPRMANVEVKVEEIDGEKVMVIVQNVDGEERVMELKGIEGIPDNMEGELAKARFAVKGDNMNFAPMVFHTNSYDVSYQQNTNCAALGVYVGTSDNQVKISSIIGGSGAEEVGMKAGDIILSVNDISLSNFMDLRKVLSEYRPGDHVSVEYSRGEETYSIVTELRAWRDFPGMADSYLSKISCDDQLEEEVTTKRIIIIKEEQPEDLPAVTDTDLPDLDPNDGDVILGVNQSPGELDRSLALTGYKLYPNPSEGQVQLSFEAEPMPVMVKVLDAAGREVFQEDIKDFSGRYDKMLDLQQHAKGSFILMIEQDGKVYSDIIAVQ